VGNDTLYLYYHNMRICCHNLESSLCPVISDKYTHFFVPKRVITWMKVYLRYIFAFQMSPFYMTLLLSKWLREAALKDASHGMDTGKSPARRN
jgi:hypothetical protein